MPSPRTLIALAALAGGCAGPSLDVPRQSDAGWSVELEPALADAGVALSFRARIREAPRAGEPWLFQGELSDYYQRALAHGDVSAALRQRAVPLRYWRQEADCVLQPVEWLEADASYTLAFSGVGRLRVFRTRPEPAARLTRLFPPVGSAKHRVAVVCDAPGEPTTEALRLEPEGVVLRALSGMGGLPRPGCFTLSADSDVREAAVAPPLLAGALVEPSLWLPALAAPASLPPCAADLQLNGACLEVLDDRAFITPWSEDQLWLLEAPARVTVPAPRGVRTLLVRGLLPGRSFALSGSVLASSGRLEPAAAQLATGAPRRHLVLNEVLANPAGPETASEWVELVNDSEAPAALAGLWLEDSGGHVALPDVVLAPHELVLLVDENFRNSGPDVAPVAGVRLLGLASLGARGLANAGEALLLVGREGPLSRFPLVAATHAGRSIARRRLDSADDDPRAFAEHASPGASPGASNTFDD